MKPAIVITTTELRNLQAYADTQSKVRTYRLARDSANRLAVLNPDGRHFYIRSNVESA